MKILNKNTNGTRNRALSELEVMQELTPGDKNYGKIAVGTDGTYEGEVLVGKDSDVQKNILNSHVMCKAQFDANAAARREQYAGSGQINRTDKIGTVFHLTNGGMGTLGNYLNLQHSDYYRGIASDIIMLSDENGARIGTKFNINGNVVNVSNVLIAGNGDNQFLFPQASRNNSVPVITDSTDAPIMKQGDMAILKDLDRELLPYGDFSEDKTSLLYAEPGANVEYDSDNNRIKYTISDASTNRALYLSQIEHGVKLNKVSGLLYEITIDITTQNFDSSVRPITLKDTGSDAPTDHPIITHYVPNGISKYTFKSDNHGSVNLYIGAFGMSDDSDKDEAIYINSISIKQVSETPIVALRDTDAGDLYDQASNFETRDSVSRQDLAFLESWSEDVADKNIVYPFGNIQYRGDGTDDVSGIVDGAFTGADTYSLFGNWQEPGELVGKGYVWSELSLADKIKLASNPENNIYRDGEKWIQVRYRIRVVKGLGNDWSTNSISGDLAYESTLVGTVFRQGSDIKDIPIQNYNNIGTDRLYRALNYSGGNVSKSLKSIGIFGAGINSTNYNIFALPIALVQRRNAGIWHETFNPEGCARVYSDDAAIMSYLAPEGTITSMADCFDHDLIATIDITDTTKASKLSSLDDGTDNGDTYKITGTIVSEMSGRPDGIYVDEINERDVEDLRMSAHKRNYDELREEFARKAVAGEIRGKEEISFLKPIDGNYSSDIGRLYLSDIITESSTEQKNLIGKDIFIVVVDPGLSAMIKGDVFKSSFGLSNNSGHVHLPAGKNGTLTGGTLSMKFLVLIKPSKGIKTNRAVSNNHTTQCDIIGDPRNLNQRIKLDITEDTVVDVYRNDYVLCTTDDQTGGTAGHYYRYIAQGSITNVHTSKNDEGNANATDGHFDLSQGGTWLDLGTDGAVGGYPTTWLEHGVDGVPLLVTESSESMLPVVGLNTENIRDGYSSTDILGVNPDAEPYKMYFKASRRGMGINKFLVRAKDGHWVTFTSGDWSSALEYHHNSANRTDNHVFFNIGSDGTLSALGYDSMEEALDLMLVKVYYKTQSNFLELADSSAVISEPTQVHATSENLEGAIGLLDKVGLNAGTNDITNVHFERFGLGLLSTANNYQGPKHFQLDIVKSGTSFGLKYFEYLTTSNSRARLQFVFKELKYDTDSSTWGDDSKFQITNKVSTLTDENGNTVSYGQKSVDLPYFIK